MKNIGAVLLVAGTCIGSGMIALPMVLAKLGLIPSVLLMLGIWFVMYYTSLVNLELNLQAQQGLALGALGKHFSGKTAELIGVVSLKLLSYALLAVFIYGGSSIIQEFLAVKMGVPSSFNTVATWLSLLSTMVLLLPIKYIDYINRMLFICLLSVVAILIVGLTASIEWTNLPLFSAHYHKLSTWIALIPVVFTSFGFQVIFHTLTNYCHKNPKMLKSAFFWGSLIPALVYIVWTLSILSVVYHENPYFYHQMAEGKAEVGGLIHVLTEIVKWPFLQLFIWSISLLAIVTSIIGVGVGLFDSLQEKMCRYISYRIPLKGCAALITIMPAYFAVIHIPNAFISVLGFAGMILAIIAIILPVYLFYKIKTEQLHYSELKANWLIQASLFVAFIVIGCEMYNASFG